MKVFLTSIGEKTTQICKEQLERFGFEVILLNDIETWDVKYRKFIDRANEDCLRIDADIIPNRNIELAKDYFTGSSILMGQFQGYDFYKNDVGVIGVTYYSKKALSIIRNSFDEIDWRRPEATAWRLPKINPNTYTCKLIVAMHGFFQDDAHLKRHLKNKIERKQIEDYDFDLAKKILLTIK